MKDLKLQLILLFLVLTVLIISISGCYLDPLPIKDWDKPGTEETETDEVKEFRVNTHIANDQKYSSITKLENGYVIVWASEGKNIGDDNVYFQIFDKYNNKIGSEQKVNTTKCRFNFTSRYNSAKKIGICSIDDGFVIAWEGKYPDESKTCIYAQRFSDTGNRLGNSILIKNEKSTFSLLSTDFGFVFLWCDNYNANPINVKLQRFNHNGAKLGATIKINNHKLDSICNPVISKIDTGYIILWEKSVSFIVPPPPPRPGGPKLIPAPPQIKYDVYLQKFDNNFSKVGVNVKVNTSVSYNQQCNPSISVTSAGFVITWLHDDKNLRNIFAQQFDSNCIKIGQRLIIYNYSTYVVNFALVIKLKNGFFVLWDVDRFRKGLYIQKFDNNGNKIKDYFKISPDTNGWVNLPDIVPYDNEYIVTWSANNNNDNGYEIIAKKIKF